MAPQNVISPNDDPTQLFDRTGTPPQTHPPQTETETTYNNPSNSNPNLSYSSTPIPTDSNNAVNQIHCNPHYSHHSTRSNHSPDMESANRFLKDLRSGNQSLGAWQMFPSPSTSRTLARIPGLSWVLIDQEHGNVGDSEMHECIANIAPYGVSPLVRIPDKERWMIKRALDAGAHGIMVPLLSTVEEVEEVVRQSKFPPSGKRGLGSPFSVNAFGLYNIGDYLSQANDNTAVIIQIETLASYENVEAFAKVPGVDVLFIGPFDLSNSLGHPLAHGIEHPILTNAIQKILDVAHANGKKAGIFTTSGEDARKRVEQGFDMVHIGTDVHTLIAGVTASVKEARGETVGKAKGGY